MKRRMSPSLGQGQRHVAGRSAPSGAHELGLVAGGWRCAGGGSPPCRRPPPAASAGRGAARGPRCWLEPAHLASQLVAVLRRSRRSRYSSQEEGSSTCGATASCSISTPQPRPLPPGGQRCQRRRVGGAAPSGPSPPRTPRPANGGRRRRTRSSRPALHHEVHVVADVRGRRPG